MVFFLRAIFRYIGFDILYIALSVENNFAKEEYFISSYSFIAEDGRMLIVFDKDNYNFYEIGHFNDNEDFIIDYLIDELKSINKENIVDYFFNNNLKSLTNDSKESQNIINLGSQTNRKCFY